MGADLQSVYHTNERQHLAVDSCDDNQAYLHFDAQEKHVRTKHWFLTELFTFSYVFFSSRR